MTTLAPLTEDFLSEFQDVIRRVTDLEAALARTASGDLSDDAVTGAIIADNSITSAHIQNATIAAVDIANATITSTQIASATILGTNIASATIAGGNIGTGVISGTHIASGQITGTHIVDATIQAIDIANATITATQIANTTITAGKIANNTITAGQIANNTVTAGQIANNTITAGQIAALTITSAEIADLTILGAKIASGTITAAKITVANLSALSADLGTITAGLVTGATLRTAASGARVVMDTAGIRAYNASNVTQLDFDTSTGNLTITGTLTTSSSVPASAITGQITGAQFGGLVASNNLLPDSSFEIGTITPWTDFGTGATLTNSSAQAKYGTKSLLITKNGTPATMTAGYNTLIPVLPNDKLVFSTYTRAATTPRSVNAFIVTYNSGVLVANNGGSTVSNSTSAWTRHSVSYTIPASGVNQVKVAVQFVSAAAAEAHYIDGVQLENGDVLTGYAPSVEEILPDAVGSVQIQDNAVTAAKVADLAIDQAALQDAIVSNAKIVDTTISAAKIVLDTITAAQIANNAITANELNTDAVTNVKIANDAVTTAEIANLAVTGGKIAANTVTAANIAAGTITAAEIAANTITANKLNVVVGGGNYLYQTAPTVADVTSLARWSLSNPNASVTTANVETTVKFNGYNTWKHTADGVGIAVIYNDHTTDNIVPAEPGDQFTLSAYFRSTVASRFVRLRIIYYDAANAIIGSAFDNGWFALTTNVWQRLVTTGIAPATTAKVRVLADLSATGTGGGTAPTAGDIYYVGGIQLERGDVATAYSPRTDEIPAGTIVANQIAANTITAAQIAANTLTANEINANAITSSELAANSVIAGKIAALTIVAGDIAANTITGGKIAANTITAANITAGTITATEIATNTITANRLSIIVGGGNLITNSGFEDLLSGWTLYNTALSPAPTLDTVTTVNAKYIPAGNTVGTVARLTNGTDTVGQGGVFSLNAAAMPAVEVGKTYTASGWMKIFTGGTEQFRMHINWYDASDVIVAGGGSAGSFINGSTTAWTRAFVTAVAPATAAKARIYLFVDAPANGGVYWFDAMQLEEGDVATAYSPKSDEILPGTVIASMIAANTITANEIAANAITTSELNADSVTSAKIAANTIVAADIAALTITAAEIAANTITAAKIAAGTITATEIAAGTITADKIIVKFGISNLLINASFGDWPSGDSPQNWQHYDNGGTGGPFTWSKVAAGGPAGRNSWRLQATSKTAAKGFQTGQQYPFLPNKTYVWSFYWKGDQPPAVASNLASPTDQTTTAITGFNPTVSATNWQRYAFRIVRTATTGGGVDDDYMYAYVVANTFDVQIAMPQFEEGDYPSPWTPKVDEVLPGTIGATQITPNSITTNEILANTILAADIAASTITGTQIAATTIAAGNIVTDTLTANQIANNAITTNEIAANTITAADIAAGTITATEIAAGTITADKITVKIGGSNLLAGINPSFEDGTVTGWSASSSVTALTPDNTISRYQSWSAKAAVATAASFAQFRNSATYTPIDPGQSHSASCWVYTTTASRQARIIIEWVNAADNSVLGTTNGPVTNLTASAWTLIKSDNMTPTALGVRARFYIRYQPSSGTTGAGEFFYVDGIQLEEGDLSSAFSLMGPNQLGTTQIGPGSITSDKINVTQLDAISANMGTILAGIISGVVITGSTVKTADSGARVVLDSSGLTAYNSSEIATVVIPVTGTSTFSGALDAVGGLTQDAVIASPAVATRKHSWLNSTDGEVAAVFGATSAYPGTGTSRLFASATAPVSYTDLIKGDANLIHYWKLTSPSSPMLDTATSNQLTLSGLIGTSASGLISGPDGAVKSNTNGQFNYAGTPGATENVTNGLSVEYWVKFDALPGVDTRLMNRSSNYDGSSPEYWKSTYITSTGKIVFSILIGGVAKTITGGTTIAVGTVYHVVHTYDGTNLKTYLNGVSDATAVAQTGNIDAQGTTPYRLGRLVGTATEAQTNKAPSTTGQGGGSGAAWTNASNITSSNNVYATATVNLGATSDYLYAGGFGFSIPTGAVITNYQVNFEYHASSLGKNININTYLRPTYNSTTGQSLGVTTGTLTDTSDTTAVLGGQASAFSISLTPAQINSANFGLAFDVTVLNGGTSMTLSIDAVTLSITYYIPITLDECAVFNAALTAGKITDHYGTGTTGISTTTTSVNRQIIGADGTSDFAGAEDRAVWRTLIQVPVIQAGSDSTGTFHHLAAGNLHASGANHVLVGQPVGMMPLVGSDYAVPGKTTQLRVMLVTNVNGTAPGSSWTHGLYPYTFSGTGSNGIVTLGTVVSGSTVTVASPGANSGTSSASSPFTFPSDGFYALGVLKNSTGAANSIREAQVYLQIRHV